MTSPVPAGAGGVDREACGAAHADCEDRPCTHRCDLPAGHPVPTMVDLDGNGDASLMDHADVARGCAWSVTGTGGVDRDGGLGHDIAVKLAHRCDHAERRAASRCVRAEVRVDAQDLRAVLAALAAAEQRADTAEAAIRAVLAKCDEIEAPSDIRSSGGDVVARAIAQTFRAALSSRVPVQPQCDTCEGAGAVRIEAQIGAPGSGGWITCPDCGPTPSQATDEPVQPEETGQ